MHDRHMRDKITSHGQELTAYRWRGVNRRGAALFGMTTMLPGSVASLVEKYWRLGWREFLIVPGEGPVPPVADDPGRVGAIEKHPDTGRRIWWAEAGEGS